MSYYLWIAMVLLYAHTRDRVVVNMGLLFNFLLRAGFCHLNKLFFKQAVHVIQTGKFFPLALNLLLKDSRRFFKAINIISICAIYELLLSLKYEKSLIVRHTSSLIVRTYNNHPHWVRFNLLFKTSINKYQCTITAFLQEGA